MRRKLVWAGCKLQRSHPVGEIDLPWRVLRTPYRIFLAELMLIRTRADVVARIYEDVFEQYPNIETLAEADENELQEALRPLGLVKRIPYIKRAAQHVCEVWDGSIPSEVSDLVKIPGIGPYTATAIVTFAYHKELVPEDVNILRFVSRLTGLEMTHDTKGSPRIKELVPFLSESLTNLPAERLLDFTRLICRPRNPRCDRCPLTRHCTYFKLERA